MQIHKMGCQKGGSRVTHKTQLCLGQLNRLDDPRDNIHHFRLLECLNMPRVAPARTRTPKLGFEFVRPPQDIHCARLGVLR